MKTITGVPIQIYNSANHINIVDFEGIGSYIDVDKEKKYGEGSFTVSDNLLSIRRTNTVGSYLICFRRYYIGDETEYLIRRRKDLRQNRRLHFNCEARNTNSSCKLAIAIVDYDKQKLKAYRFSDVLQDKWIDIHITLEFNSMEDYLLQVHQFDIKKLGRLELRNITIIVD